MAEMEWKRRRDLEDYESAFSPGEFLLRPADDTATYGWIAAGPDESALPGPTVGEDPSSGDGP